MPDVTTKVDVCTGHDACQPRPFTSFSPNVFAETFEVARQGDSLQAHGCPHHPAHSAIVSHGWQTVLVNGAPLAAVGSTVSCPSGTIGSGRPSVLVGEGRQIRPLVR
jgi:uncharacterized Zn-binding protein involved in type VI secretion